jgi:hypothetical protein
VKIARFDAAGGVIVCEIVPGPTRDGAYELKLWEANANKVIKRWLGNFINTADDQHDMPTPNQGNHERIVELVATVSVPPGAGPCTVSLLVTQDGVELQRDQQTIPPNTPAGLVNVFVGLEAAS